MIDIEDQSVEQLFEGHLTLIFDLKSTNIGIYFLTLEQRIDLNFFLYLINLRFVGQS
jgi:hypothetical protein